MNEIPNSLKTMLWKAQIDASSHTFKIILMDIGFDFDKENHNAYADVSAYELPTANGYTAGGATLTLDSITTDDVEDRCEVTFLNATWTATGGSLSTVGAIMFDDSTATGSGDDYTDAIVAYLDIEATHTVADGVALTISNIMISAEDITTSTS